jgi:enterochelin esterase-like enzyme
MGRMARGIEIPIKGQDY